VNGGRVDVAGLGTVLGVWAHPDDEAYLSGGLMALARDAGSRVVCVTATRGEHGTPDPVGWPPDRLAVARTAELARCLAVLGVHEHHWLGYVDGELADVDPEPAVERLSALIAEVRPHTVLTFGPDGITGHPDHQTVSRWARAAFDRAAPPGVRLLQAAVGERWARRWADFHRQADVFVDGYPITVPDDRLAVDLRLDRRTLRRKVRALRAQETQTAGIIAAMGLGRYTEWVAAETFVDGHPSGLPQMSAQGGPGDLQRLGAAGGARGG
jgi:LmbE family N-acetylglucosaminyl deacetylase